MKNIDYKALVSKSPIGFALHHILVNDYGQPVDYEFIEVNASFEALTGLKASKIINRRVTEVLPEIKNGNFSWIDFYGKVAIHGGEEIFEQYSDPLKRYYKVQVFQPEKNHFATVFVDITEHKLSEQRYQGLVESQNDLIVRVDTNNRFTFVNKAYCETFGKNSAELLGSDFFPLIHEDDREATAKAMELLQKPPYRCYIEQRALTVKGWRWLAWEDNAILDINGKIIETQGVGRDITELKEKEEAITKQAASLQNLLAHTPAVIYAYTFQDGLPDLHYINENLIEVLGFKPADFLHNFDMWKSCVYPDDLEKLAKKLSEPPSAEQAGKETYSEYRFRDKAGKYHWLSDRQKTIINNDGQIEVIGAWVDITPEKKNAEILNNYKRRLSLAQNFAKAGAWEYDIETGKLYWSAECEALFGLKEGSFEGSFEAFLNRIHPDDREMVVQTNAPIVELKEGVSLDYEHRIITPKGETKWVKESAGVVRDAEGKASHIIGLVMDISKRKLAEDAMENEKKLRDIVDNIEGVFWLRSANRVDMLYVSPAYEEIFGMSRESLYKNPSAFVDAAHPDDRDKVQKAYGDFLKTGKFEQEYRIIKPDGEMRWIATKAFPVKNNQGDIIRYAGISEDVTKRKLTEQSEREKTNNLNATIAALPDILFFMSKDGTYLDVHTKEPEKLLVPKESIIGRKIGEFFDEAETAKQLRLYKECVEDQALKIFDYSIEIDGKTLYFEARLSPVDDQKLLAIVRDVTEEKIKQDELVFQTKLQKMLMEISNTYIDLKTDKLDEAINNSLRKLGSFIQADRCYVFEYDYDNRVTNNTHEWCAEGIKPEIQNLQNTPFEAFPEWLEAHQKGKTFFVPDVLKLPKNSNIRSMLEPQNIRSLIAVPLMDVGKCTGFIGFDAVRKHYRFNSTEELLLKLFAKMLVSVQKRFAVEKDLIESENKFQKAFMTSPYSLILSKLDDGTILEVNHTFSEVTGYSREEAIGKKSDSLKLWNKPEDRNSMIKKIIEKGSVDSEELLFKNRNGEIYVGLISAQLIELRGDKLLLTSVNDITEKKEQENTMRESEHRFSQVAELSQTVIWETDTDGLFTYVSPMAEKIWGYAPEELVGKRNYFYLHPEKGRQEFKRITRELLTEKQVFRDLVNPVEMPNGELAWMSTNGLAIYNDEMQVTGFRGSDQNITEIRKLLDDLTAAKNKAEESDRLKSAFLATISHELRTPLNHILGFSSLISDMTAEEETKNYADIIQQSGEAFLSMIEDIFDLAFIDESQVKLRNTTFKGMEFFMEAKNSLSELLQNAGKSDFIKLAFAPDHDLLQAYFHTDRQKIMMVLTHLFRNAVKFTNTGDIDFGMYPQGENEVVFYVKDTGIGIEEDMQEVIFDLFRQVEDTHTRQHDGLGIGLSIAKKIAETLMATISMESSPGEGSTFYLRVPISIDKLDQSPVKVAEPARVQSSSLKTILVAEDDETSMFLVQNLLRDMDAKVIMAKNGQQAVERFQQAEHIDLVLMDLKMPVMDGYEATRQIKSLMPKVPVIAITAFALAKDKPKALEAGCDAIITKPIDRNVLYREMNRFIT